MKPMKNPKVTETLLPTSSNLKAGIPIPLQVPLKTIRSNSVIHKDPTTSGKFSSQEIPFGSNSSQFYIPNLATKPLS